MVSCWLLLEAGGGPSSWGMGILQCTCKFCIGCVRGVIPVPRLVTIPYYIGVLSICLSVCLSVWELYICLLLELDRL